MKTFYLFLAITLITATYVSCKTEKSDIQKKADSLKTTVNNKTLDTAVKKQTVVEYFVTTFDKSVSADKFEDYLEKDISNYEGVYAKVVKDKETGKLWGDENIIIKKKGNEVIGWIAYFPGPKYNKEEGKSALTDLKIEKNTLKASGTEDGRKKSIEGRFVKYSEGSKTAIA